MESQGFEQRETGLYYHYTTRRSAQESAILGMILLGQDGKIYLTDVLYEFGWQATNRLSLPEKNAEVAVAIPENVLPQNIDGSPAIEYEGIIPEFPASSGRSLRRGGGHQWVVRSAIPLSNPRSVWIALEIP